MAETKLTPQQERALAVLATPPLDWWPEYRIAHEIATTLQGARRVLAGLGRLGLAQTVSTNYQRVSLITKSGVAEAMNRRLNA